MVTTASAGGRREAAPAAACRRRDGRRSARWRASGTASRQLAPSTFAATSTIDRRRRHEAEPVDDEHVEDQERRRDERPQAVERAVVPLRFRDRVLVGVELGLGLLLEAAPDAERDHDAAEREPDPDHHREDVRPDLLPRHRRQPRAAIGGKRAERDEEGAGDAVGELHRFAIPPDVIPGPRAARSPEPMNTTLPDVAEPVVVCSAPPVFMGSGLALRAPRNDRRFTPSPAPRPSWPCPSARCRRP